MKRERLSKRVVDALVQMPAEYVRWDADLPGFGVRVRPSGAKSFVVMFRVGGRNTRARKVTLGQVGKLTVDQARDEAKRILARAELGEDVGIQRAIARKDLTIKELLEIYFQEGCVHKKHSTLLNDRSRAANHVVPLLGQRYLRTITSTDVAKVMRDVAEGKTRKDMKSGRQGRSVVTGGKGVATQVVRLLSALFSFAVERKLCSDNPALKVQKFKGRSIERFLSVAELEALGEALREAETVGIPWEPAESKNVKHAPRPEYRRVRMSPHVTALFRLLMFTGARLGEILKLRWIDVDNDRGILFLPDSKTGRKPIVLSSPAIEILEQLPRIGAYVIAGSRAGMSAERPRADVKRPWKLLCSRAGIQDVRIHDLRHTFASVGAAANLGLPVIGRLLGHSQAQTTSRYAHLAVEPLRNAANLVAGEIEKRLMGTAISRQRDMDEVERSVTLRAPD